MAARSRMNREVHVRICEGLGVKFPGATRPVAPQYPRSAAGALVVDSSDMQSFLSFSSGHCRCAQEARGQLKVSDFRVHFQLLVTS